MTPMQILQGNPTISGRDAAGEHKTLPFDFGWTTHITGEVEVTSALVVLFLTSAPQTAMELPATGAAAVAVQKAV